MRGGVGSNQYQQRGVGRRQPDGDRVDRFGRDGSHSTTDVPELGEYDLELADASNYHDGRPYGVHPSPGDRAPYRASVDGRPILNADGTERTFGDYAAAHAAALETVRELNVVHGHPGDEPLPYCFVCGRVTDHVAEHDDLVDRGLCVYEGVEVVLTDEGRAWLSRGRR